MLCQWIHQSFDEPAQPRRGSAFEFLQKLDAMGFDRRLMFGPDSRDHARLVVKMILNRRAVSLPCRHTNLDQRYGIDASGGEELFGSRDNTIPRRGAGFPSRCLPGAITPLLHLRITTA